MVQKNKLTILTDVERILHASGYGIVQLSQGSKACFDIIAKKKDQLIIIKIEPYIDNFSRDNSYELKNIASFLNASPMIIGERGRRFSEIDDGLVLLRYGIPVVSTETFGNLIVHGVPPIVYCSKGGYFVQINRKQLRQARIEKNLSYADLAHLVGASGETSVSRRTIYEYEHSINPPPMTAALLEEILETPITQGIRIFDIDIEREERPDYSLENLS
ncbi:MAG: helix-turn-helix domain-containing protein, partial [Candidatus Heimdallarchaeaceae archaeon]